MSGGAGWPAVLAVARLWWREARGRGGLWLLLATLTLAVTATTLLNQSIGQVRVAAQQQSGQLLGGDLVVSSSGPLPEAAGVLAQQLGLRQTPVLVFSSMLQAGDPQQPDSPQFQLVNVKAVRSGYPLRGQLSIHDPAKGAAAIATHAVPQSGQIWLEPALLQRLGVSLGETVQLGDLRLQVTARIERDPNRELGLGGFAPTVLVSLDDVPAMGVLSTGSRADHRLLLAGSPAQLERFREQFRQQYAAQLEPGEQAEGGPADAADSAVPRLRLRDAENGNRRLLEPLRKFDQFSQMANVMTLLLCGLAIAYTVGRLSDQLATAMALLRSLGASPRHLWLGLIVNLLGLWLLASVAGAILGGALSYAVLQVLRQLLPALELDFAVLELIRQGLPAGMWTALLTLLAFGLPALWQLLRTAPVRVLRQGEGRNPLQPLLQSGSSRGHRLAGLLPVLGLNLALLGLLLWLLGMPVGLALLSVLGGLLVSGLVWVGLTAVLMALQRWRSRAADGLGQSGLLRRPGQSALQLWSLAIGLTLMSSLWLIRGDLLARWQQELPPGTANQFVFGLPPDQRDAFAARIDAQGWQASPLYPMVKARMGQLNGQPFAPALQGDFLLRRELNLSMADRLPDHNVIVAGRPFDRPRQLSVELETAHRLGLKVGDRVSVWLPTGELTAEIVNLRTVKWDSFSPNFFLIYSPGSLDAEAGSYVGSFYVPPGQQAALTPLVRDFATTMLIDIQAILDEVRRMVQLIGQALGLLGGLAAMAGLLVLMATLDASLDVRRREAAILRTLGMSQQRLRRHVLQELFGLGAAAGLLAMLLAEAVLWGLSLRLGLEPVLHGQLIALPLLFGLLAMLVGWLRLRSVWQVPAWQTLRR